MTRSPLKRVRRWRCKRQHDKGYRPHSWFNEYDAIVCLDCGERREVEPRLRPLMADALSEYRQENGWR